MWDRVWVVVKSAVGVAIKIGEAGWMGSGCSASDVCWWVSSISGLLGDGVGAGAPGAVSAVWTPTPAVSSPGEEVVDV